MADANSGFTEKQVMAGISGAWTEGYRKGLEDAATHAETYQSYIGGILIARGIRALATRQDAPETGAEEK